MSFGDTDKNTAALVKLSCGCWAMVEPKRGGKRTAIIDAVSFLCREGHKQDTAVAFADRNAG